MSVAIGQTPLAAKEASLFRQVLKHYETKQYKKGLKAAEQILRKNPKHGETMAMKGLLINCQGRKEEGFTIAKEALRYDMKSHVCWHVYGLLWRSEKNFDEAIKAYKMALRFEPESQQILRDLALLQIQMRDYAGYVESRRTMVITRPQVRQNWTGLAIAHHLAGNLAEAENVLTKYEETLKQPPPKSDIENSEAILYKNYVIAETGDYERALLHLEGISKIALDRVAVFEAKADLNLKLDNTEAAEKAYRYLVDRNADKREYYVALEKVLSLEGEAKTKFYGEYAAKYPRADAPQRIPLDFLEGDAFREAADAYLKRLLTKGVPSTFANLKALYGDAAKLKVIEELVEAFLESQRDATKSTDDETKLTNGKDGKEDETMIWTLYYLAMHNDHYRIRSTDKALTYINEALEMSPDKVELRMGLARIMKHAGDTQTAMEEMNIAREKDSSDRFINTKSAKYQLRNDKNEDGLKTMSLFTRNEAHGGPLGDLIEMQCVWYLTEDGESYNRQGKLGLALKRFHAIYKIFEDWTDDQFDFHSFSLRKGMIRSYIEMVRWEDSLWSHPFFSRAAIAAVKIYILLNDKPHLAHDSLNGTGLEVDFENLSTADRKKAMKKAKREQQKLEKVAQDAAAKAKDAMKGNDEKKQDDDPFGAKLAQTHEPLDKAQNWLNPLIAFSPKILEIQALGFEVYIRRQKYLLALKCLLAAHKLSPDDATVHEQIITFQTTIAKARSTLPEPVVSIIDSTFDLLPKDTNLSAFNESYLQEHKSSAKAVFAVIRARQTLAAQSADGSAGVDSETLLLGILDSEDITLVQATEGMSMVKESKGDLSGYVEKARAKWLKAVQFKAKA